jgi:hypothetical protein
MDTAGVEEPTGEFKYKSETMWNSGNQEKGQTVGHPFLIF